MRGVERLYRTVDATTCAKWGSGSDSASAIRLLAVSLTVAQPRRSDAPAERAPPPSVTRYSRRLGVRAQPNPLRAGHDESDLVAVDGDHVSTEPSEPHAEHDLSNLLADRVDESNSASVAVYPVALAVGEPVVAVKTSHARRRSCVCAGGVGRNVDLPELCALRSPRIRCWDGNCHWSLSLARG